MTDQKFNRFSVPLGLLDYVNPILYAVTMLAVIKNIGYQMVIPYNRILFVGAAISIFFGLIIPTGKVLVGLGVLRFRMPVSLVFCVNTGILISGMMLLQYVSKLRSLPLLAVILLIVLLLFLIYLKTKKMNTVAVLTGAIGYLLIYGSLITISIRKEMTVPIVLYAVAIGLFVMLCGIGIKADLKNPKVHWVIEISNVLCQFLVALATIVLFSAR
ncbi:MAG: hypothetical protein IKS51_03815 [Erysipelotrichaceae bacterium]|nr:hypothetical protein [Erysipelotrichaceae bacterium]